ncbi:MULTISPECIES: LysM peptidoglycan-binding domain-containing protein [unclassified Luteimonas]
MSNPQNPNDPDALSLKTGSTASGDKPDFSNVKSSVRSTEAEVAKPDFSNVQSSVHSTEEIVGETEYTVQAGDTLSHIAKAQYGKASQWRRIFDANRDQLDDPDRIKPGQVLKVPAAPSED